MTPIERTFVLERLHEIRNRLDLSQKSNESIVFYIDELIREVEKE